MRIVAALVVLLLACPLLASEYELVMLPVEPSVVLCGYHSRYDTRLVVFNEHDRAVTFADNGSGGLLAKTGRTITGPILQVPLPTFMYVPKSEADGIRMSLMVESSNRDEPEARSFTELPVVRASEFREGKLQLIGVRMDPGFRQTVRIFGLDPNLGGRLMMRVYPLDSTEMLHSCEHEVFAQDTAATAEGLPLRPAFGMECDMTHHLEDYEGMVRIELEPLTEGLKFWAFVSVTNNKTNHFYTVLPK